MGQLSLPSRHLFLRSRRKLRRQGTARVEEGVGCPEPKKELSCAEEECLVPQEELLPSNSVSLKEANRSREEKELQL